MQQSVLIAIGLQRKKLEDLEKELSLPPSQLLAMFLKIMRKMSTYFRALVEGAVADTLPSEQVPVAQETADAHEEVADERFQPLDAGLEDELREGGEQVNDELREKQKALIDALPLDK